MAKAYTPIPSPSIRRLLLMPALIALSISVVGLVWSVDAALSAAFGAMTALLPTAYFAFKVFRYRGASKANLIVHEFYRAESGKFVLTAVMFAVIFSAYPQVNVFGLFGAYIATTVAIWLAAHRTLHR